MLRVGGASSNTSYSGILDPPPSRAMTAVGYWCQRQRLFSPDLGLANNPAVLVVLFTKERRETGAAHSHGQEPLRGEFVFEIGRFQRAGEQLCELSEVGAWRFGRSE